MPSNKFIGVVLWVFALNVFVYTHGGKLEANIWLDIGTGLALFMVACYYLGSSLVADSSAGLASVMIMVLLASAVLTVRVQPYLAWQWWDTMTVVAAPQVVVMAIGSQLAARRFCQTSPG